jgi:hypothetical protein
MDMSGILLPDPQKMAENPDPCALFYFLHEACIRGGSEIIQAYISELDSLNTQRLSKEFVGPIKQGYTPLSFEYFMIEAAAHGQQSICNMLMAHCEFNAYTM